jgi:uncharacterized protein YbgA (DUF1722 family)/uncharacterized protein YbbK (DUF523 family)
VLKVKEYPRPRVVISKCIEFDHCRWNGAIIKSPIVAILKSFVDFNPVCAEVEIGLGIPRDPVRIVKEEQLKMMQISNGKDYTEKMVSFSKNFIGSIENIDGFLLKSKSPSCGLKETKYFHDIKPGSAVINKGSGLFGREVMNLCPHAAIETEGRLMNFRIREHWLTKLYTLTNFRTVKESQSIKSLTDFQAQNKFLFMAYNQNLMRTLGKIAANSSKDSFNSVIKEYEKNLFELLYIPPEFTSHINVLMHTLGFFKNDLATEEKAFFLDELEKFRAGWIPLFMMIELIKSWMARVKKPYLQDQTYFSAYPEELMNFDLKDAWRGRSYWNPREK